MINLGRLKFILSASFISVFSLGLRAQIIISGEITDVQDEPVPGVTVQVVKSDVGTITDATGKFSLSIPEDISARDIEIRSVGYKTVKKSIPEIQKNSIIQLQESTLDMDAVVVTGTMEPTFITQSPIKVEVITSKHLNDYIPMAASSIVEGITLVNGVQEVVACGVCFTNSISINGLPGPYTAVLMDGTPIYGNLASVYGLNGIPSMIIDRFEVIKGPNSTLYGSEAVAGVINIITKDPESQPKGAIDVMGTTNGELFGNLSAAPKIGKSSGFVGLNFAVIDNFNDENNDGFSDIINMDRYSLFTKWNIHRRSGKKLTIAGKYYYEDRRNGVEEFLRGRNYLDLRGSDEIYGESIFTQRYEVFGTYEFDFIDNFKVDYSFSTHDQNSYYGADHYTADQTIGFGNFVWSPNFGKHSLNAGFTARYQAYDDNTVATEISTPNGIRNQPDEQFIPGIFVQDEYELNEQFTVMAGGRLDHYRQHGFITSPRLNLKYKTGEWTTIRGNFGTGFRIVNLFTEDHAFVTGQREVVIEEALKPEESYNASFNFNHIYTVGTGQGMFDVDVFYTYFTNKIIPDYEQPGYILYANTNGYSISRGIGVTINHEFEIPLSFNAGFNLQDVTETTIENDIKETRQIEFAPDWTGVLTANYRWEKANTVFAYTFRTTGPMQLPEVYDLDEFGNPVSESRPLTSKPFSLSNIQVTKRFSDRFSIYGGVENIFDYIQPWSPLVGFNDPQSNTGFSDQFDTSYAYAPIHGREFYLGLTWNID